MDTVKTAISLPSPLFQQADEVAREMDISRSRLVRLALEDFILRYKNKQLFDQINAAYEDGPDPDERAFLEASLAQFGHLVRDEPW
jgi:metal-responsive CopG/Arc/MetJ family transcriptional regulator